MRLGHSLFRVFVGQDGGASGVQRRIVVGMVEVPVRIDYEFHRSIAQAVERRFQLGPSGRKESIYHELAVRSVQHHHVSAGTAEQSEIVGKLLRLNRRGSHLRAKVRHTIDCGSGRLLPVDRRGGAHERPGKQLRQEGAAGQRG